MKKLLTVKDVADLLSVSPKTLYQWAEYGSIPCFKLNGTLRFNEEKIIEWVNSNEKKSIIKYNSVKGGVPMRKGGGK
ncbi:MAG: helix-turn-helix domain-containing protein [Deltaproteobacteria bacterium]|nr:helix-turn-helix domain-containing protein [Deltaproteobacteria bacterium]